MDIAILTLHLVGLGLLMLLSFFFSGSETALTALSRAQVQRIRKDRERSSRAIVAFVDEPRRLFITVLFGNTLVNMAFVSITGAFIFNRLFQGKNPGLAYLAAILSQTLLILIFGEITPKTYAIEDPERFSRMAARHLWTFSKLIYPFRKVLRFLTDMFLPVFGVRGPTDRPPLSAEELKALVRLTEEQGALDEDEGEILHNIFELHDIPAKEAMVPRTKMVCVEVGQTIHEAFEKTRQSGFSRLPVYRNRVDNICGIFYVKDFPRWQGLRVETLGGRRIEELTIEEFLAHTELLEGLNPGNRDTLIRPPFFVFKTQKIGTLMREMTRKKQQMAVVLDEYGGVSGLITVEDISEEVLGEIFDEYDKISEQTIAPDPREPECLLVPGFVSLRSVNRRLRLRLDLSAADTISGYIVRLVGSIPEEGAVVQDPEHRLTFEVLKMAGKRIRLVKVRPLGKAEGVRARRGFFGLWPFGILVGAILSASVSDAGVSHPGGSFAFVFALLLVVSLLLRAFFAGSETAVVSASRARIEVLAREGNPRAQHIERFWRQPDKMLGTVLVGQNVMDSAAGVAALQLFSLAFPGREGMQQILNTIVMTAVLLLFCEILPKAAFRAKAEALALRSAPALWTSALILRPVVSLVTGITGAAVRAASKEKKDVAKKQQFMREELRLLAQMGEKEGTLRKEQLRMISSVLDLESMTLERVMTPLVDVVALPVRAPVEEYFRVVAETGYSRIPVYEERVDKLVGIVNVLDVLYSEKPASTVEPYVRRRIRHEPESRKVYSLLRELKDARERMGFVVDEYGGVVGIVTIEDLIEEILGDIRDEKDRDIGGEIQKISDRIVECDGKTEIQVLNNVHEIGIPAGDYNTIAGYVLSLIGRIPRRGEEVETGRLKIMILDADQKSIRRVRIQKKAEISSPPQR
ncbi:MAG: hemolysin family protein [Candidatus Aminicenantales bacterium]